MKARTSALLLVATTGLVAAYMLSRALALLATGDLKGILLAVGVLMLIALGGVLISGEVRLGMGSERLAKALADVEVEEPDGLERRQSGRLTKESAAVLFAFRKAEVEAAPGDWRGWWLLAQAYGEARDTVEGRRAMRRAIRLEKAERTGEVQPG